MTTAAIDVNGLAGDKLAVVGSQKHYGPGQVRRLLAPLDDLSVEHALLDAGKGLRIRPTLWTVWAASDWVLCSLVTSATIPSASPPACLTLVTVSSHERMSAATTVAPFRAKARQYSCPIPRAAPVTMATRSLSF